MHQLMLLRHLATPPGDEAGGGGVMLVVFCQIQESLRAITRSMVRMACLERESN